MATMGNNNAGKPVGNSTQSQSTQSNTNNQSNQANQGNQANANDAHNLNQALHQATNQAGAVPAVSPAISAAIPAHGVMYAANSVGNVPAGINNGEIVLAQNGDAGGINTGNAIPITNAATAALNGATQYSPTNPAPISNASIETFFPFTPPPPTNGEVITPPLTLPNTLVGPGGTFADNVENILSTSAPLAFNYGTTGPINAGFPTTYVPEGTLYTPPEGAAINPLITNNLIIHTPLTTTPTPPPTGDISIIKFDNDGGSSITGSIGSVVPGHNNPLVYTITVSNTGPSTLSGGSFVDNMPAAITGDNWSVTGTTGTSETIISGTGNISDTLTIPTGGSVTFTVDATNISSTTGDLVNTATVTPESGFTNTNPNAGVNGSVSATDVDNLMTFTKTDNSGGVVAPTETFQYTVTIINTGTATVNGATVFDPLVSNPNYVAGSTSWTATEIGGASGFSASGTNTNIDDTSIVLPAGSEVVYTVTATVAADATSTINNTATFTPPAGQTYDVSDTDNVVTLSKSDTTGGNSTTGAVGSFIAGVTETYHLVLDNTSPNTVSGVISDLLSTNPNYSSFTWTASDSDGTYTVSTPQTGNIDTSVVLPTGDVITYTIEATIAQTATTPVVNEGVFTPTGSSVPITAIDTDTLSYQGNIGITKVDNDGGSSITGAVGSVVPGNNNPLVYTITVSNTGPSNLVGASFVDNLPSSILSDTWSVSGPAGTSATIISGTGSINDTITVGAGESLTFTVDATNVNSSATGDLVNTATVTPESGFTNTNPNAGVNGSVSATDVDNLMTFTKTDNSGGVVAPTETFQYTVTIINTGTATVNGATVFDPLVSNPNYVAGSTSWTATEIGGASGFSASGTNTNIDDTSIVLPAGSEVVYTVTATVAADATSTINNTATFTPPAGQTYDVSDTDNVVTLSKSDTTGGNSTTGAVGSFIAGVTETYHLVLDNTSPNTVSGVISDLLSTNPNYSSFTWTASDSDGTYTVSTPQTGNIDTSVVLPTGDVITYTIEATIAQTATTPVVNEGVFTPTGSSVPITAIDTDTLSYQGNIGITKVDNDGGSSITGAVGSVVPGNNNPLVYTITVSNTGPSNLVGASFVDNLPSSILSDTWSVSGPAGTSATIISGTGSINDTITVGAGESLTFTVDATNINSSATGDLVNTATVTPESGFTNTNPNAGVNGSVSATDVDNLMTFTKTDNSGGVVAPTETFQYTVTIINTGTATVNGATVFDPLVSNPNYVAGSTSWTATEIGGASGFSASGTNTNIDDTSIVLPAGSEVVYTVTATVAADATSTINNTATFTPPAGQTYDVSDTDNVVTLSKSDTTGGNSTTGAVGSFIAGVTETYHLVLDNTSPNTVSGVISDLLSTNPNYSSFTWTASDSDGTYTVSTPQTGNIDTSVVLPTGDVITYTIEATIAQTATTPVVNEGVFTPTGGNVPITATDIDTLTAQGAISITKVDSDGGSSITGTIGHAIPGTTISYTIVAADAGPSNLVAANVTDTLPTDLTSWTVTGPNGFTASGINGGLFDDTNVNINAGGNAIFTVVASISPTATGEMTNTVTITPPDSFTNTTPGSTTATDIDNLTPEVNLSIVKTDNDGGSSGGLIGTTTVPSSIGVVVPGQTYTYTIDITNSGPSTINHLTLSDVLPTGFTATGYNALEGSYNSTTGAWTGLTLASGDVIQLQVTGYMAANALSVPADSVNGEIANVATVTVPAGVFNTNPNNTATDIDSLTSIVKSDSGGGSAANGIVDKIGTFVAGAMETYTITVSNPSVNAITGTIFDPLNSTFLNDSWSTASTGGASAGTSSGTGTIGSSLNPISLILPADSTITFTVTGTEALTATGTVANTVTYTPTGSQPVVTTDYDNIVTVVKTDSSGGSSPTAAHPNGIIGTFVAGAVETYHITLTNTSTNTVTGSLSDSSYLSFFTGTTTWNVSTLGAGDSVGTTSGTGAISNDSLTIAADSSITFNITGTVEQNAPSTVSNTADFTPTGGTTIPVTDTDNLVTVVKADSGGGTSPTDAHPNGVIGTFVAGAVESYTITIDNISPNSISGSVSDSAYLSFFTGTPTWSVGTLASGDTASITSGTGAISSDSITVAAGSSITFTVTGTVSETASSTVTNTVDFTPLGGTTIPISDTDNIITVVKTDSSGGSSPTAAHPNGVIGTFVAGAQETYHITLTNTSPNAVSGSLSDSSYLSFFTGTTTWNVSTLGAGDSVGTTSGTGAISNDSLTIAADSSITFNITGTVEQNAPSTVSNTADFTPIGGTTIPVTDTDSIITVVKTDSSGGSSPTAANPNGIIGTFVAGALETYHITLTNASPYAVSGSLSDSSYLSFFTGTTTWNVSTLGAGDSVGTTSGTGAISNDSLTIAAGSSITFNVTGTVEQNAPSTVSNTADFTPTGGTAIPVTDTDNLVTVVKADSGGGTSPTDSHPNGVIGTFVAGAVESYTITIDNTSPNVISGAVSDSAYLSFFSGTPTWSVGTLASGDTASITSGTGAITNDSITVAGGSSITFTVTGTVSETASSTVTNTVDFTPLGGTTIPISDTDNIVTVVKTDSSGGSSPTAAHPNGVIGTFVAGAVETYHITLTNTSTNAVSGSLSDSSYLSFFTGTTTWNVSTLGAGDSVGTTSGTGAISNDSLTIAAGSSITFNVTGTVEQNAPSTVSNTADFTPTGGTTIPVTDTDNLVTVVKADSGGGTSPTDAHPNGVIGTFVAGAVESYTITIDNTSPNVISGAVSDSAYLSFFTGTPTWSVGTLASGDTASITSGTGAITGDSITVAAGSSITFTVTGTVSETCSSTVTNTVNFTPLGGTTIPITDTDNIITVVKTDSGGGSSPTAANPNGVTGSFTDGASETYHVTITNTSPNSVTGSISDSAYLSFFTGTTNWNVSTLGAGDSVATTSGTGAISNDSVTIAAGSSVTFNITGTLEQNAPSTVTNTADFTPTGGTTIPISDTDNTTNQAVLTISKTDNDGGSSITSHEGTAIAGDSITYTIIVKDTGSSNAYNVSVVDTLPLQGLTNISSPNLPGGVTFNSATDTWTIGTLTSGSSDTLTLMGTIPSGTTGSTYTNVATATSTDASTVQATDTDLLSQQATLTISKIDSDGGSSITNHEGTAIAGDSITYTIVVSNTGPSSAYGVSVVDTLPTQGLTGISTSMPGGVTFNSSTDTWTIGTLTSGSSDTLTLTGTIPSGATGSTYTNVATATSTDASTVQATDTDLLSQQANLTLTKTDNDGGNVKPGESITYTIVVSNTGPSSAYNVSVVDTLPTQGLSNISSTSLPAGVTFNSSTDTWTIGTLAVGASDTLTLVGTVPTSVSGSSYTNEATATASDATTVHAFDTDTITPICDVSIVKTAAIASPYVSEGETYTLSVQNNGPSSAANVTVTDVLPTGITYVSGSASNSGSFNSGTDTLTWNLGTIAANASTVNLTFEATINSYVYQVGTTTAASLAALESAWGYNGSTPPSTLHGYILGVSDESSTSPNNLDITFANAAGTVTANYVSGSDIGIGVTGTGSTSNEINTSSGQTETLVADLGHSNIESATITLSGLSSGSVGQVVAYNSSGVEVGGPILFQATGGSETTTITVNPGTDFQYLAFSATSDGSVSQAASANGISSTSSFTVQDIQSLPDSITNTATVSSSTSDSNLANNTSSVTIHPEVPTAGSATQGIAQGAAETNILIVLDRTGSMADDVTVNGQSVEKIKAAITAIDDLLALYGDEGNVAVKLVDFNTTASILTSSWMSIATVESLLSNITPTGETNYDAALGLQPDGIGINYTTGAEEAWTTTGSSGAGYLAGGSNVLYFVTDGGPNYPSGSAGINPEYAGNAGEEAQWQTFLTTNNITAFAIALGISANTPASDSGGTNNDTVGQELTPIASNANDALFVTNYSQLSSTLTNTIVNQSGNILTETGSTFGTAGAGHIASIALIGDGYTFDFNPTTNAITTVGAGSATETFNASTEMLTITSSTLGTFSVYMENSGSNHAGDYTYSAPSTITSTTALDVPVQFTIADSAGNQATGLLNIIDTHDAIVASNASGADQAVIVTIVDESSPHNSFSQLVDVPNGSSGAIALNLATEFTFTSGHDYAVSIEAGSTNTAALTISGLVVDGLNLQSSGSITLGGASNPLAATYQFDAPSSVTQSETNSVSSTTNHSLVYYLDESGGSSVSATNTTSSSLADFLNGGNNETVNNTTSNPSVMVYNPTDTFNGNGQDILRIDQGATGMFLNTSNIVNLTGNTNIHNIGEILITDAPPADTGNTGSNGTTLTLTAQDVFDMTENSAHTATGNSNTLYINGNSADTVNIGSGWTNAGTVGNYAEYTQTVNNATDHLYIMSQMHIVAH